MSAKRKVSIAVFVVAAFLAGVFFTTLGANLFGAGDNVTTISQATATLPPGTTALDRTPSGSALDLEESFIAVVEAVSPTVVQIRSEREVSRQENPFENSPLEEFFGPRNQNPQLRQGLGSGVIVRPDGYIVTNNHVIEGASELEVRLADGRFVDAEIVGTDPESDLAVIKIEEDNLPSVSLGHLDDVRVGQWVLAFGSPLSADLDNTVTAGIVSAMGRTSTSLTQLNVFAAFIQTDASINPGNSGGPLINLRGELIGINTAIFSRSGGSQGIGFAIPVNVVENATTQLIETGSVQRGFLGVNFAPVPEALAEALEVSRNAAQVTVVLENSAAYDAGLQEGDIIVAVDNLELRDYNQLRTIIGNKLPGESVTLTVVRDGDTFDAVVTLGLREVERLAQNNGPRENSGREERSMESLGLSLNDITPTTLRRLGLEDANVEGVIITEISTSSAAFREAELRRGDIITEIDRQPVRSRDEFLAIYRRLEAGDSFLIRIVRVQQGQTVPFLTALTKPQ